MVFLRTKHTHIKHGSGEAVKYTSVFAWDFSVLSCLLQLYTRLHLSDYRCFGTLKDTSLLINSFLTNNCFSGRNIFQNGVDPSSKIDDAFLTKSWPFHLVRIIRLCSNLAGLWHKHLLWNFKKNFRLPMSAFETVTRNTLLEHKLFYTDFCDQVLSFSIAVANSISSKYNL